MDRRTRTIDVFARAGRAAPIVLVALSAVMSPARGQDQLTWTLADNSTPTPRWYHAMAFDRDRGSLVLFGGHTGETDTWEWHTGTGEWHLAAAHGAGPSRRAGHAMAYDPVRHVTVLAGGSHNGTSYRDVWEWNGAAWTQRTGTAQLPELRNTLAMVFDDVRGKIVAYGGTGTLPAGITTLEYDGITWTPITTAFNPGVQNNLGMAYDKARGVVVMVPSGTGGGALPVYEYAVTGGVPNWVPISFTTTTPGRREFPLMTYDETRHVTILHGGSANNNTWTYNGVVWTQVASNGPQRNHSAMVFDPVHGEALLYSGNFFSCQCDSIRTLSAWNGTAWSTRHTRTSLDPIFLPAMAFDESRNRTVVFGGVRLNPQGFSNVPPLADIWEWNGQVWNIKTTAHSPGPRYRAPLVYDSLRHVMILHGGAFDGPNSDVVDTTWEYDGTDWVQVASAPIKRHRFAAAFDRARGKMVVFGGQDETGAELGDTWEYDGTTWAQLSTTGPGARRWPVMAYDAAHARTVLFGGAAGTTLLNDTWVWDGSNWARLDQPTDPHPPTRQAPGFAYDADRGRVVMYGGHASAGTGTAGRNDAWVLSGSQWAMQTVAPPPVAKTYMGFAYDTGRHAFVLAGGSATSDSGYMTAQTWEAAFPCYANCDNSSSAPTLNSNDFQCFLNKYAAGDSYANCDGSTSPPVLNVNDFQCFLNRFAVGCE